MWWCALATYTGVLLVYVHVCVLVHVHVCVLIHVHACVHVHVCVLVHVHVYTCIYLYRTAVEIFTLKEIRQGRQLVKERG